MAAKRVTKQRGLTIDTFVPTIAHLPFCDIGPAKTSPLLFYFGTETNSHQRPATSAAPSASPRVFEN